MELNLTADREGKLSSFLRGELKMSSGLINRLKYRHGLLVNGEPAFTNRLVVPGDRITVLLDEETPEYPAEPMDLQILYDDKDLLALDKPAGMLIHPSRCRDTGTLANGVAAYYQATGQHAAFHPCTRLDRDTFGIVLLAKNSHVHSLLNALHGAGKIRKTYHALVLGCPDPAQGRIEAPIARKPLPSLLREIRPNGAPSVTEYTVLARFPGRSLLELHPITGRTHQLRLHCAYIGCPILGDPQYGTMESGRVSAALGFETQRLCAVSLDLPHPMTGELLHLQSRMDVV